MTTLSRLVFGLAGAALMVLSVSLISYGAYRLGIGLLSQDGHLEDPLLAAIGYVVIAIAVFDVAKFIIEEEVMNGRERRIASEARRSLTKFISTIAIAVFLEALVMVFRVSSSAISDLLYPTVLLMAGTLLVIGLGVYQRLSVTVESEVEKADRRSHRNDAT